jgi:hypothetical protein
VVVVLPADAAQSAGAAVAAERVGEHAVEPARRRQHPVVVVRGSGGQERRRRGVERRRERRQRGGAQRGRPRRRVVVGAVEPELLVAVSRGRRRQEREPPRGAVDRYAPDWRRQRRRASSSPGGGPDPGVERLQHRHGHHQRRHRRRGCRGRRRRGGRPVSPRQRFWLGGRRQRQLRGRGRPIQPPPRVSPRASCSCCPGRGAPTARLPGARRAAARQADVQRQVRRRRPARLHRWPSADDVSLSLPPAPDRTCATPFSPLPLSLQQQRPAVYMTTKLLPWRASSCDRWMYTYL